MRVLFYIILFIGFSPNGFGQDVNSFFKAGNKAYKESNYIEAIKKYQQVLSHDVTSSELLYNLGNAYKKSNQLAYAILYYEKALRLAPGNNNIKTNLEICRSEVDSDILEIPDFLPIRLWRAFSSLMTPLFWIVIQIILGGILLYGIYGYFNRDPKNRKNNLLLSVFALFTLLIVIPAGNTAHNLIISDDNAIVLSDLELRNAPDQRSENIEPLSEGEKVRIIDEVEGWFQVRLMNKELGWLEKNKVGII